MSTLTHCLRPALAAGALTLFFAAGARVRAQGPQPRIPVTRQESPLTRDPKHPSSYEIESEQQNAAPGKEVERTLRAGNEATDAKPPRYEDAEKFYREALRLNPKEARAYLGLGRLYAAQNRADAAAEAFLKAIELKPKLAEARFNLGMIYVATGHKDRALEQHRELAALNADLAKRLKEFIDK